MDARRARCPREPGEAPAEDEALAALIATHGNDLVTMAQQIQHLYGYVPESALATVSRQTGVPLARLLGIVSFYAGFHTSPRGRRVVRVCTGTACHVRGAGRIARALGEHLGVEPGGTTDDREHTLEHVACLGCCSLAPVVRVGEDLRARVDPRRPLGVLEEAHERAGEVAG